MRSKMTCILIASTMVVGVGVATVWAAEDILADPTIAQHAAGGKDCLPLNWHIKSGTEAGGVTPLSGPLWFEANPGMSFAKGSSQKDGTFSLTVTTARGAGPAGTITGKRNADGSTDVKIASKDVCFKGSFHLAPGETSAKL